MKNVTVKELKAEIRKVTADFNTRIAEYRESGKTVKPFETMIKYIRGIASASGQSRGEIGYGFRGKHKTTLQTQLTALRRAVEFDIYSNTGKKEYKRKRYGKSRKSFEERYGKMSDADFEGLYDTFDTIRSYFSDFGYEALGPSLAAQYQNANAKGKKNFADYVLKVKKESGGGTTEDFIDQLIEEMQKDGAL